MQSTQSTQLLEAQSKAGLSIKKGAKGLIVRPLQLLLYRLGYAKELNWDKYRADGGYGGSTTAAVQAFLKQHKRSGDGTKVDSDLLRFMLEKQAIIPDLLLLKQHLKSDSLDQLDRNTTARLLQANGVQVEADQIESVLKQLADQFDMPFSGATMNKLMAGMLATQLSKQLGPGWEAAAMGSGANQRRAKEFEAIDGSKTIKVLDSLLGVNLIKVKDKDNGRFKGLYTVGDAAPFEYIQLNRDRLVKKGLNKSVVRVLLPVSKNEGNLDGVNTWDNCFMTFGMFQWTLGKENKAGELASLLKLLKGNDLEAFSENFGRYGIDVVDTAKTTGYISVNGQKIKSIAQKETIRTTEWAYRFWKAGLDPRVQDVEIMHAADRINSFLNHKDYMPLDKFHIQDLITSEYGMCLILDHSVNRPGHLMRKAIGENDILGRAMVNAGLDKTNPSTWGTAEEAKLIKAYLPLRAASSMTHAQDRADRILAVANSGELNKERNSFEMIRSRSLRPVKVEVDYPTIDPAEYESRVVLPADEPQNIE